MSESIGVAELPTELVIPFAAFAASMRPRVEVQNGRSVTLPGHADEIWLKLLQSRHGAKRMTRTQWVACINGLRAQPAHESDPRYVKGT